MNKKPWYSYSPARVAQELATNLEKGLSKQEVIKRQNEFGFNRLPEQPQERWVSIFVRQLKSPFMYLLFAAAFLKLIIESYRDGIIILIVIFINALIGAIQEGRAQSILAALKKFLKTSSMVLRDGERSIVDEEELIPGDIIILQEGWRVPADARLISSAALQIDEASLTGESVSVKKNENAMEKTANDKAPADQHTMVFMGTYVLSGTATAIVVATGTSTEIGEIQKTFSQEPTPDMPLKKDLDLFAYFILLISGVLTIIIFLIGILQGYSIQELFFTLTSLFVSIVPESIPIVSTIILAVGAFRMARSNVLIKKLPSIEAIGRIQVLIVDKTGTLTHNEQMVVEVLAGDQRYTITGEGYTSKGAVYHDSEELLIPLKQHESLAELAHAAALLDNTEIAYDTQGNFKSLKGEPIHAALGIFAAKLGFNKDTLQDKYHLIEESPFDAARRTSSMTYQHDAQKFTVHMGAPEIIMKQSKTVSAAAKQAYEEMLAKGLRMVALAKNDQFLGLIGMQDAVRTDVASTVREAKAAGLRIVMATGDHKETALYVARQAGIFEEGDEIVEGKDFRTLDDATLDKKLMHATVIARVTPSEKLDIIRAYHRRGYIVGMTGDGVNDAPALAIANVGIAMGKIGTEVAKEAADIVLLDDSLSSIITGIAQGRSILVSMRRIILFLLTENISEVAIIALSVFLGLPLPLLALQILWQHMLSDSFLDVGLAMEPSEKRLHPHEEVPLALIDRDILKKVVRMSIVAITGTMTLFLLYYQESLKRARTIVCVTFTFFQWFNAWNLRSEYRSVFRMNPFSNPWLLGLMLATIIAQIIVFANPTLRESLHFTPLSWQQWLLSAAVASFIVIAEEIKKYQKRKTFRSQKEKRNEET
jgi:magnesium-transporting ATPase (P-type)